MTGEKMEDLAKIEDLRALEEVIERGLSTFLEVGAALMAIRDGKKYKADGYKTFDEYCQQRWNFTQNYARRLVAAAEVVDVLPETVPIGTLSESQLRPLAPLRRDPGAVQKAWGQAVKLADGGSPTAAQVTQAVAQTRPEKTVEMAARREKAEQAEQKERSKRTDFRYVELERHLHNARRVLTNAVAVDAEFSDEHKELLADSIRKVRDALALVELKHVGAADVDWDAELAKLDA